MNEKRADPGRELSQAAVVAISECARAMGRHAVAFTPEQLDDLARAARVLLNAVDLQKRLAGSKRA